MASKWIYPRAFTFNPRGTKTGLLEGASSYQHGVQMNICTSIHLWSKGPITSLIYRSIFVIVGPKRIHRRVSTFDEYWIIYYKTFLQVFPPLGSQLKLYKYCIFFRWRGAPNSFSCGSPPVRWPVGRWASPPLLLYLNSSPTPTYLTTWSSKQLKFVTHRWILFLIWVNVFPCKRTSWSCKRLQCCRGVQGKFDVSREIKCVNIIIMFLVRINRQEPSKYIVQ